MEGGRGDGCVRVSPRHRRYRAGGQCVRCLLCGGVPSASHLQVFITHLKGQCHEMDIFLRSKHFNQHFLCMRWWFSRSFKSFSLPSTIINFLFASFKLHTNFQNAYWNPHQNFLICDRSMFSSADLSLAAGKCARINLSPAALGIILQNHRRLPVSNFSIKIDASGSLKLVTGRIFKIRK
jgi:hypothetical protein